MSLDDLSQVDLGSLSCATPDSDFDRLLQGFTEWGNAQSMVKGGQVDADLEGLRAIQSLAEMGMQATSPSMIQGGVESFKQQIETRFKSLHLVQTDSIA
jgi:muramoyltetrapeptide carboxypeptidase LdcA involved in peptidoglycan recycling